MNKAENEDFTRENIYIYFNAKYLYTYINQLDNNIWISFKIYSIKFRTESIQC